MNNILIPFITYVVLVAKSHLLMQVVSNISKV